MMKAREQKTYQSLIPEYPKDITIIVLIHVLKIGTWFPPTTNIKHTPLSKSFRNILPEKAPHANGIVFKRHCPDPSTSGVVGGFVEAVGDVALEALHDTAFVWF